MDSPALGGFKTRLEIFLKDMLISSYLENVYGLIAGAQAERPEWSLLTLKS